MKHLVLIALSIFLCLSSWAQGTGEVFSKEDIKWKPEFTVRTELTIPGVSYLASFGMRINHRVTVGVMGGHHNSWHDASATDLYSMSANAYARCYFHLGPQQRVSFFVDGYAGPAFIYKEVGKMGIEGVSHPEKGDVWLNTAIEAGVRLRLYKNIHVFTGPLFGTRYFGLHAGVGF